MNSTTKILLVGAGGYGCQYIGWTKDYNGGRPAELVGIVDPNAVGRELNVPLYRDMEDFYRENTADLAIIATPIHLHKPNSIYALQKGSHVLCEKPAAGSLADAEEMARVCKESGKMLAIGFQWSYNPAILAIKSDIMNGLYGKHLTSKTLVLWPRSLTYFARSWTGKRFSEDGQYIMDSVANNATAHYLHNLLFLQGSRINETAVMKEVEAHLYKANNVETFDTAEIKITIEDGSELLYYTSHCTEKSIGPLFECTFENGRIVYDGEGAVGYMADGQTRQYGRIDQVKACLYTVLQAIETGESSLPCDINTAMAHARVLDYTRKHLDDVILFPEKRIITNEWEGNPCIFVQGLDEDMLHHYENNTMSGGSLNHA